MTYYVMEDSLTDVSYLEHYGTPRHSGRYPWGSGKDPYQSYSSFTQHVSDLHAQGMSDAEIAKAMGMTTSEMRARRSYAKTEKRAAEQAMALKLKQKGYSNVAIGKRMGIGESQVRSLLDEQRQRNNSRLSNTVNALEKEIKDKKYVDVGSGTEIALGVSDEMRKNAITLLKDKGYSVYNVRVPQLGTGKYTTMMVAAPPGVSFEEVVKNKGQISPVMSARSNDSGDTFYHIEPPVSIDSKRVAVRYGEDGGKDKDGVIEIRRGVDDLSLGGASYAQVRIAVDGTHYLKGMAVYGDDLPAGKDIVFNTNKHKGVPMMGEKDNTVLKNMKDDEANPFGATIKSANELVLAQRYYTGKDGKQHQSAINIVKEEGNWSKQQKNLASQMLSKQTPAMAEKQLKLAYSQSDKDFNEIKSLTNPTVKQKLLTEFADECDSKAVHLKAAALPRSAWHVILPITSLKSNEIYAPNYKNGEEVALIRYPHAGRFEIPVLRVNNNNKDGDRVIKKTAIDAVGINSEVAARLSGADFDGDTVLVIPTKGTGLKSSPALEGLKNFDPSEVYSMPVGSAPTITNRMKQKQMGVVSNLITDMTIKGASPDELARAVRHSMVIIDSEKHNLNWKQSEVDNNIKELKQKYQAHEDGKGYGGASTLLSRAKSEERVHTRKEYVDSKTGEKKYVYTDEKYTDKNGNEVYRTHKSTKMAETRDAYSLSSGTQMENIYAEYANNMKRMGNEARKLCLETKPIPYSASARKVYQKEVDSLNAKLTKAKSNKPLERQAQAVAGEIVKEKRRENPDMDNDTLKKVRSQALNTARLRVGAKKEYVDITDKEWEAIQAGAVSPSKLSEILDNADSDRVKQLALPRNDTAVPSNIVARARSMKNNGATTSEIADALGYSVSTINEVLKQ